MIIPNKDHTADVCVKSLMEKATYKNLEYIIIDGTEPATFEYYEKLQRDHE